ncbi:MAG TPA: WXG100 family type VII secretion target [Mycobacteriales bacterium]|nr:WXG100 family type VII secretion target [Mycobacteriales bacterium]
MDGLGTWRGRCLPREVAIIPTIRVDLSTLVAAEQDFRQALNALQAELDRLDAELRSHLDEWSGDARAAYWDAHTRWQRAAEDMVRGLDWLHESIRTARDNYHSARAANLAMWRGHR